MKHLDKLTEVRNNLPEGESKEALSWFISFYELITSAHFILLNANDVWAWGCADSCQVECWPRTIELLGDVYHKWGPDGEIAFMAHGEGLTPQEPLLKRLKKDTKYDEALEFLKGKSIGVFRSAAYEEFKKDAEIKTLKDEVVQLKEWVESQRLQLQSNENEIALLKTEAFFSGKEQLQFQLRHAQEQCLVYTDVIEEQNNEMLRLRQEIEHLKSQDRG